MIRPHRVVVAAALLAGCAAPAAAPSPSPSATATITATSSPIPSPSPSPSPSPTTTPAPGTYTNFGLDYRLELPTPWRRSDCLSTESPTALPAGDTFVRVGEQDERGSDIGFQFDSVGVTVEPNPDRISPRDFVAAGRIGGGPGQTVEDATLDGRAALLVRSTPPSGGMVFVLPAADRMYVVGYQPSPSDPAMAPTMERIVRSFHLLTEQERAGAPSSPPTEPRSAENVADALAAGFARRDPVLLFTVVAPCMSSGHEQAGGSFTTRTVFMTDLASSFAAGLRVAVTARPIESDTTGTYVRATWTQGTDTQRRDLYLRRVGSRWSWWLTLTRMPGR